MAVNHHVHNFALVITRPELDDETAANRLFAAGCDDGTFSVTGGVVEIEFDREAETLVDAVSSAIRDIDRADIGSRVIRVIPDDLVNAAAIAERSGRTRQAVRFWTTGDRGERFPPPKAVVGRSPVWSWMLVAEWLHQRGELEAAEVEAARLIAELNRQIEDRESRRLAG